MYKRQRAQPSDGQQSGKVEKVYPLLILIIITQIAPCLPDLPTFINLS
jgi:hypothetical protein